MGYSYDTWRTTHPDDLGATSRFMPETVKTPLCIEGADVTIDAYGTYDACTGGLLSVEINGKPVSVPDVTKALAMLGCSYGEWDRDLDAGALSDLVQEAAQDEADDYGDYLYERYRDDE